MDTNNTVLVIYRDEVGLDIQSFPTWEAAGAWAEAQPAPYAIVSHRPDDRLVAHLVRDEAERP